MTESDKTADSGETSSSSAARQGSAAAAPASADSDAALATATAASLSIADNTATTSAPSQDNSMASDDTASASAVPSTSSAASDAPPAPIIYAQPPGAPPLRPETAAVAAELMAAPIAEITASPTNDLVKSLSEQLTCSICQEIVFQPVSVLDCLHTFCGACLLQWISSHPANPECPTCRSPARATKDSHQHNSLRDVLLRMDASLDRSAEEKAEMNRIYTPGSSIDLVQTGQLVPNSGGNAAGSGANAGRGRNTAQNQLQMMQMEQRNALYANGRPMVIMNPIDELNLLLRYYFPCPTCEPSNPYGYLCTHPIPDPRLILALGPGATGGQRPIPRIGPGVNTAINGGFPAEHTQCFNCKRPNLIPKRDKNIFPQDVCKICDARFCGNLLGYCGPIKQPKARAFSRLSEYVMPPKQGIFSSITSNIFGSSVDPKSISSFMPLLFSSDPSDPRVRSFDAWLANQKRYTLDQFYHAVIEYSLTKSRERGDAEPGLERAPWQGRESRGARERIRKEDWVCLVCAKDLVEHHAREWYNEEVQRDAQQQQQVEASPHAGTSRAATAAAQDTGTSSSRATVAGHQGMQSAQLRNKPTPSTPPQQPSSPQRGPVPTQVTTLPGSTSFFSNPFSSIKKGFTDLGDKVTDLVSDSAPETLPPPAPASPLPPALPVTAFPDRVAYSGNQFPNLPPYLATSRDTDGHPVFLAIYRHPSGAMVPGKLCPNLKNPVRVCGADGKEYCLTAKDKYELFLENRETMKWIRTGNSFVPASETPVQVGLERDGVTPIFFACAWWEGVRVPGLTGPHTNGAKIAFNGTVEHVRDDYELLVWTR